YYSHEREVFARDGMLYAASEFVELIDGEQPFIESVRYRTVGDMTCTGAVRSIAKTLEQVVAEIAATRITERGETRADDRLTDGLRAEREQGITIDVAYRYFSTPRRKFIIADTPGHEQYTRNMVTGASTADLSIVLIDARNGVSEQTRRHAFIASLLRIPHLV